MHMLFVRVARAAFLRAAGAARALHFSAAAGASAARRAKPGDGRAANLVNNRLTY